MKIHHNKRSKDCNFCDNEIGNKDEIVDHNDKKAEEIVYKYQRSESEEEKSVPCNWCEKSFKTKGDDMHHKKREHTDYVQNCWNFISGLCEFNEDSCWFKHSPKNDEEKPQERSISATFVIMHSQQE